MVQYCLLRNGEQSVEIALLRHESIEAALLGYSAVFQHYYAIVAAQLRFLKRMGNNYARYAVKVKYVARDLMRRLRVKRSGGLVRKQYRGFFQQASRNAHALLFTAGKRAAVFAAKVILPALRYQLAKVRAAYRVIKLRIVKRAEHGNVILYGCIEHEHVLLYHGYYIVKRFRRNVAYLNAVKRYTAGILGIRRRKKIEQCGFSATATTNYGVCLARLKPGGNIIQHALASLFTRPSAALRPASSPGREAIGSMVKFIRFTKSITAPGVSPYPFSAKYAPAMNGSTVSAAAIAVIRGE